MQVWKKNREKILFVNWRIWETIFWGGGVDSPNWGERLEAGVKDGLLRRGGKKGIVHYLGTFWSQRNRFWPKNRRQVKDRGSSKGRVGEGRKRTEVRGKAARGKT